ncbi:glycosyltransferase 87 family protein [Nocardioides sp. SYSU D00065]|uniref:glycosyltransferase 87 family protein n=1 Tax=Nocardioides sp. SYSU D00065 TaxID=2817378 RepID=UPI001B325CC3|nr:glycosyltransferase 87 family protein [Nocardioides sp. SYSU D00065]
MPLEYAPTEPGRDARSGAPWVWLAATVVLTVASTVQKLPCLRGRVDTDVLATAQCYSDVPLFYVGRGLAADFGWFGQLPQGYRNLEYPPLINLFIEACAKLTHVVTGTPSAELSRRARLSVAELYAVPGMADEERTFFLVTCAGLLASALGCVWVALRTGWRLGDRVSWAMLAPVLVLTLTVNWDAIALLATALALLAWQRGRVALFGGLVALGTAAKLFPLVLLAAGMIVALRARSARPLVTMTVAFLATTVVVNAPLYLSNPEAWSEFWDTNADRPASFGSLWIAMRMIGLPVAADQLSLVLALGMLVAWAVLAVLTRRGVVAPTFAELALVLLLIFFVLGKVYSPQYSLWVVLGLLLVTRERWLIGVVAAAETWHYVATWLYIRGFTTPESGVDKTYWSSIVIRLAAEAGVVVYLLARSRRRATLRDPEQRTLTAAP